jgi:mRNA interferase RelE/StbE
VAYRLEVHRRAQRKLRRLARSTPRDYERIENAIDALSDNPRPHGTKRLASRGPAYRIRIGEYRVIYAIFDADPFVHVLAVWRRGERTYDDIDELLKD